ncbi:hypothetical protein GCM10025777_55210 [Membranihabitans marinus]
MKKWIYKSVSKVYINLYSGDDRVESFKALDRVGSTIELGTMETVQLSVSTYLSKL